MVKKNSRILNQTFIIFKFKKTVMIKKIKKNKKNLIFYSKKLFKIVYHHLLLNYTIILNLNLRRHLIFILRMQVKISLFNSNMASNPETVTAISVNQWF